MPLSPIMSCVDNKMRQTQEKKIFNAGAHGLLTGSEKSNQPIY